MGYEYKLVIDGAEYFNEDIFSCEAENCTMKSGFEIGNVISGALNVSIRPKNTDIPRMASVDLYIRRDGGEWREKGKYFIAKRVKREDDYRWDLECYDKMRTFAGWFRVEGEQPDWPMSMQTALNYITSAAGIELDERTVINPAYMLEYTNERLIREVLSDIASAHAGNFIITDSGKLRLVPAYQTGASYDIGLSAVGFRDKNNAFLVGRVVMFWDDGDDDYYTSGSGLGNEIVINNPNATQQIVNDVYAKLSGHLHIPFEASGAYIEPFFELGDTVTVGGKQRTINGYRTVYSAEIASDLYNPSDDEIEDEFEYKGEIAMASYRSIKDGSWYYGVSITRKNGIQVKRTDGLSEMTMNSDMWEVMVAGKRVLYIDYLSQPPKFVFNGEFGADVVIAQEVITQNFYADNGAIANLTVNRLRTDWEKPWRYLSGDTTPLFYLDIHDEQLRFLDAVTDGAATEQYTNLDGQLLYWRDGETGGTMTTEDTGTPVVVYVYQERNPGGWAFESVNETWGTAYTPVITLGQGDATGRRKARIYKTGEALRLEYDHSGGDTYFFELGENGIASNPEIGMWRGTQEEYDSLSQEDKESQMLSIIV